MQVIDLQFVTSRVNVVRIDRMIVGDLAGLVQTFFLKTVTRTKRLLILWR
jgi:hypothetical protein